MPITLPARYSDKQLTEMILKDPDLLISIAASQDHSIDKFFALEYIGLITNPMYFQRINNILYQELESENAVIVEGAIKGFYNLNRENILDMDKLLALLKHLSVNSKSPGIRQEAKDYLDYILE